jgi:hypothetical protein
MQASGLATWFHSGRELIAGIDRLPTPPPLPSADDPADVVLAAAGVRR